MVGREWKPGDVAMVNDCTRPDAPWESATCVAARTPNREATWLLHDTAGEVWSSVSDARPLVVIDPEDREQVEALILAWAKKEPGARIDDLAVGVTRAQAALRSLIADPKPAEPMGLGAVVEDADGDLWFRMAIKNHTWAGEVWQRQHASVGRWSTWDTVAAVKVLSEGVTQ